MITLLLEHGKTRADPNMNLIGQFGLSPWEEALTYVFEQSFRNFSEPREDQRLEQIEMLTVLLIYGANPRAMCKTRRAGVMSASDIIDGFLKGCGLPQALELKSFLATRVAEEEDFIPNHRQGCSFWGWICIRG